MDHLDEIEKLSNRISRHARPLWGWRYPSAHTFDVLTTRYIREAVGDAGGFGLRAERKDDYYVAKLVAYIGDNFKYCIILAQSGAQSSEKVALVTLWTDIQTRMLKLRPIATTGGTTFLRMKRGISE